MDCYVQSYLFSEKKLNNILSEEFSTGIFLFQPYEF